jgi:hypothetical protein
MSKMLLLVIVLIIPYHAVGLSTGIPNLFPTSTRQALLQKAEELGQTRGCYSAVGWSNRLGSVLTPAAPSVYTADRPFFWNKIDVGCRMTVIELPVEGSSVPDLWVHSPVFLDGPLQALLQKIGNVRYVVSPNYEHVKFASQWAMAYPDAEMWACPGMMRREPETRWTKEIPTGARCDELWPGIQALHSNCEVNPFTGKPFFNEVVFYHISTKTLLTTDLYWNYPAFDGITNSNLESSGATGPWELAPAVDSIPLGSKLWKVGMDQVFRPFYNNLMVQDKEAYQDIVTTMLFKWDVETLIPAHGDLMRGNAVIQQVLKAHFGVQ